MAPKTTTKKTTARKPAPRKPTTVVEDGQVDLLSELLAQLKQEGITPKVRWSPSNKYASPAGQRQEPGLRLPADGQRDQGQGRRDGEGAGAWSLQAVEGHQP